MNNQQIIDSLISTLILNKIKRDNIDVEDLSIDFTVKNITYNIYVEDEETVHYGVKNIEDAEYSEGFLHKLTEYGDVGYLNEFLDSVKEGTFEKYRKVWLDLQKLEDKYEDLIGEGFPDIVHEKY